MDVITCPISGCPAQIAIDRLLCTSHWYMVPPPLRREVNDTWRARRRARVSAYATDDVIERTRRAHQAAKDAAIAAVEEQIRARPTA